MADAGRRDHKRALDHLAPAARQARLGGCIYDLINGYNDMVAKYNLLLAHIDAGNVAGLGTANAATYAPATAVILLPDVRS